MTDVLLPLAWTRSARLDNWFTCQLCGISYNPVTFSHEHPHCRSRVMESHWLARALIGALYPGAH